MLTEKEREREREDIKREREREAQGRGWGVPGATIGDPTHDKVIWKSHDKQGPLIMAQGTP